KLGGPSGGSTGGARRHVHRASARTSDRGAAAGRMEATGNDRPRCGTPSDRSGDVAGIVAGVTPAVDLFTLRRPARFQGPDVSPELARAIESQGCTGIRWGRGKLRR